MQAQLGRPPRTPWSVALRCLCGKPKVIETGPLLDDGTPFPTLWWLSCKKLVAEVGRLEASGALSEINERLLVDPEFKMRLRSATEDFCRRRDGHQPERPLGHPGGGPDRVKCLHAHLAHYLVTGDNPVGEVVMSMLGSRGSSGPEPCV